jgi:peptide chain release factor subunit 3
MAEEVGEDSWERTAVPGSDPSPNGANGAGPASSNSAFGASVLSFNPSAKAFTPHLNSAPSSSASASDQPLEEAPRPPASVSLANNTEPAEPNTSAEHAESAEHVEHGAPADAGTSTSTSTSANSSVSASASEPKKKAVSGGGKATREREQKQKEEERLRRELEAIENEDTRPHVNIVFIGHVDAGKSTVGGQILFRTGMVDDRTISKYEKEAQEKNRESWYMAYVMDINDEERNKGKTVEVGRANFSTSKKRYSILDAPGHKNYVPNMIHGASQADLGVLVIAARRGEFETGFERGGQTREHAQLAKTLGVTRLIVVVNKMDHSSVAWSKERYDEIVEKTTPFLKSCGYNPKRDVTFVPISGLTGENIIEKMPESTCSWYNEQSLVETLDNLELAEADPNKAFRMPVLDKYRDMGVMVIGKSEAGIVAKNDRLMVMPNKLTARVLTVWVDDEEMPRARPNENTRLKLEGIEEENVHSGFVLCHQDNTVPAVMEFDATLSLLELPEGKSIFTAGYKAVLHIHTATEECEITNLIAEVDPKTKKPKKGKCLFLKSNSLGRVRIRTDQAVCLERFKDYPQLGRFTLRDQGKTIAVGKVEKVRAVLNINSPPLNFLSLLLTDQGFRLLSLRRSASEQTRVEALC